MRANCFHCVAFESHRCRNQWIGDKPCPDGLHYEEYTGSTVRQCLCATVEVFQDGYIHCPIIDEIGCEKCMERFGDGSGFLPDDSQNYQREPRWKRDDRMSNCGLPKGYEDQCCLNRSGMCTLDTADFKDIERATSMRGCGFIGVNDRYLMWKYEVPYKDYNCGNCNFYKAGEYSHGHCTCDQDHSHTGNERYEGAHACERFMKKGSEEVAKKTKQDEVCAFCGHFTDGYCDIHDCKPMYADEIHGCTYWQSKSAICPQQCGNCSGFIFTTPAKTWGVCNVVHTRENIHKNTYACDLFYKEGEENVAKKNYWTKCGREFQKNSTAEVTGYEIDKTGQIKGFEECVNCPFPVSVTEGWPPVHKRWECRAGSEKPNHKTEWTGSLDDKNTIHIHSLNHELLEEIKQYCIDNPDLGAGYNADYKADCRRTLAINCSSNKKGIAAKKALIEKFFPEVVAAPVIEKNKPEICSTCDNEYDGGCLPPKSKDNCVMYVDKQETCETCGHSEDWGESVEYIKCAKSGKRRDVRKKQQACTNYIPVKTDSEGDPEEQLDELLEVKPEQTYIYRGLV